MPLNAPHSLSIEKAKRQRIAIVGLPCSGKTSIGHLLAFELGWHFIDLDKWVGASAGFNESGVSTLIASQGEEAFRHKERDVLANILHKEALPYVLACGGGTPCYFDQMSALLGSSACIYLSLSWEVMAERLRQNTRPLLAGLTEATALKKKLEERLSTYKRAPLHLSSDKNTPEALVAQILAYLRLP